MDADDYVSARSDVTAYAACYVSVQALRAVHRYYAASYLITYYYSVIFYFDHIIKHIDHKRSAQYIGCRFVFISDTLIYHIINIILRQAREPAFYNILKPVCQNSVLTVIFARESAFALRSSACYKDHTLIHPTIVNTPIKTATAIIINAAASMSLFASGMSDGSISRSASPINGFSCVTPKYTAGPAS